MLEQENELRSCAREFVKRYERLYWGSEENRRKYLMPGSFVDSPEAMEYVGLFCGADSRVGSD